MPVRARLPGRKMLKLFRSKLGAIRAAMWKSRLGERFGLQEQERPRARRGQHFYIRAGSIGFTDAAANHLLVGDLHGGDCWDGSVEAEHCHLLNDYRAAGDRAKSGTNYHRGTANYRHFSTNCDSGESPGLRVGAKEQ